MIPGWWTEVALSERMAEFRREAEHQRLIRPRHARQLRALLDEVDPASPSPGWRWRGLQCTALPARCSCPHRPHHHSTSFSKEGKKHAPSPYR
jgi:hypothetical protein